MGQNLEAESEVGKNGIPHDIKISSKNKLDYNTPASRKTSPPVLCPLLQSYMEDHLKNKDRLEKEWEALCAYQAEPNACTTGMKDGNTKKNRSTAVVACKHLTLSIVLPFLALLISYFDFISMRISGLIISANVQVAIKSDHLCKVFL